MSNDIPTNKDYYFVFDVTEYIILIVMCACFAQFSYYLYVYKKNLQKRKDSKDTLAEITFLFVLLALSTKIFLRLVALIGAES